METNKNEHNSIIHPLLIITTTTLAHKHPSPSSPHTVYTNHPTPYTLHLTLPSTPTPTPTETKGVPVESQNEIRRMLQLPPLPVSRTWSEASLSDAAKEEVARGVTETAEGSQEGQGMVALIMTWISGMWALIGGGVRGTRQGVGGNMGTMVACVAALQVCDS